VQREGVVESLGDLGILFLMFLAGSSSTSTSSRPTARRADLRRVHVHDPVRPRHRGRAGFDYGLATALLFGSLWASHTLVAYPIVQEHGLLRDRSVGIAGGGR
jgi:Kef-type K+ transport system membrane component KefB